MRSMSRNVAKESDSVVSVISNTLGCINEIDFGKLGILINRT